MPFWKAGNDDTVIGEFHRRGVPVTQIAVLNQRGKFERLEMLIDTGFEGEIGIKKGLVDALRLLRRSPSDPSQAPVFSHGSGGSGFLPVSEMVIRWLDQRREVMVAELEDHVFSGQLGLKLLGTGRLTIDVVENGRIAFGPIPRVPWFKKLLGIDNTPERFHTGIGCGLSNCADVSNHRSLLWTDIEVMDNNGQWRGLHAYVDTGDNGALGLSSAMVRDLGLVPTETVRLATPFGKVKTGSGQALLNFLGDRRSVEFYESQGNDPPKLGMKLLRGHRITADFFSGRTRVRVVAISSGGRAAHRRRKMPLRP